MGGAGAITRDGLEPRTIQLREWDHKLMDRKPTLGSGGKPWYTTAYRRAVIDMHIPDWDDRFLSRVNVYQYVNMLMKARAQSIVSYAMSHVGLFNYPTKVGLQHKGLKGRNLV